MFGILWRRSIFQNRLDCLGGYLPQRGTAVNGRLRAGVIDPSALKVQVAIFQAGTIMRLEAAVDAQKDHGPYLRRSSLQEPSDLDGLEQLSRLALAFSPHGRL